MWFQLWDIVGFSSVRWSLVSSGPYCSSVLGNCGFQFRLTGNWPSQDPRGFGFEAFWGSVQVDGFWSPENPLGLQFWGTVRLSYSMSKVRETQVRW